MSRASIYNRNYPGKKLDKGTMPTHDAQKIIQQYMEHALTLQLLDNGKPHASDTYMNSRLHLINLFSMCMAHTIRVSNNVDVTYMLDLVNAYMSTNENGIHEALKLVCSFIEAILFQSDRYSGFNNYKWSHSGSNAWHNDHPHKYDNDTAWAIASAAQHTDLYTSQEYHRIYY